MLWSYLTDSRSLFLMEPHVTSRRSFDDLQCACQALFPRASGGSWWVPAIWSRASSAASCPLLPSSPKMPARSRLHAGEKSSSGASLLLAVILGRFSPFPAAPSPSITKCSCDRSKSSHGRGKVTESFGLNVNMHTRCVACHMIMCLAVT